MKKLILAGLIVTALFAVPSARAAEVVTEEIICPQAYGGGVVCGVKTHEVIETGVGENMGMIGAGLLGASAVFAYVSKKFRKSA